jgi:transposase
MVMGIRGFAGSDLWKNTRPLYQIISVAIEPDLALAGEHPRHRNGRISVLHAFHSTSPPAMLLKPVLLKSKYIFLKNPENLTEEQATKMSELLGYNLRVIRAYLMKEDFERFWEYKTAYWSGRFLDAWCVRAMRSKMEPMKKFVKLLRKHRELLMNWFRSKGLSSGVVEGFNNKVKLTVRKSYGFGSKESMKIALFHALGKLPEPKYTHRFW